jgi:hypothetical protein
MSERRRRSTARGSGSESDGRDRSSSRGRTRSGGSGYRYRRRSAEEIDKRAHQSSFTGDSFIDNNIETFSPKEGDNFIRILPPTWDPDAQNYGLDVWVHYGIGPNNSSYACPWEMHKEPCPACEEMRRALDAGDEEFAQELKPSKRVLCWIVDRDEKDKRQAWSMPWTIDRDISTMSKDKRTGEILYVDDPEDGYDIILSRDGKGMRTRYTVSIDRRPSPLDNDDALQHAVENPLDKVVTYFDYDHIAKEMGGGGKDKAARTDDDADDDDEPQPGRGRRNRSSKREEPELTAEQVLDMEENDLLALIDDKRLKIDDKKIDDYLADNDLEGLANDICDELGL